MLDIKFHIVALPQDKDLRILNGLRDYFYCNGFRYTNQANKSGAHITLAEGGCKFNQTSVVKTELQNVLQKWKPFQIKHIKITNEIRKPILGECEYSNCWIALLYNNESLKKLGLETDGVLQRVSISTTDSYTTKIQKDVYNGSNQKNVIANHINLCNRCRPNKAEEAVALIEKKVPKVMTINKVALRLKDASIAWEIPL